MDGHKAPPPLRSGRRGGMTVVRSAVLADRRLSLKARGLFLLLQTRKSFTPPSPKNFWKSQFYR